VDIPLCRGEIFNLDGGCAVDGYVADIFREACIGEPANSEDVRLVEAIIEAKDSAIAAMRAGQVCGRIWTVAAETLDSKGFGALLADTSLGHSIGLELHELPTLSRGSARVLEENMVFCGEPWTIDYTDWSKGRNFEDMVRVTSDGTELLSDGLNELMIVGG
jgi:Xaa-Pro aminopeptidase